MQGALDAGFGTGFKDFNDFVDFLV